METVAFTGFVYNDDILQNSLTLLSPMKLNWKSEFRAQNIDFDSLLSIRNTNTTRKPIVQLYFIIATTWSSGVFEGNIDFDKWKLEYLLWDMSNMIFVVTKYEKIAE